MIRSFADRFTETLARCERVRTFVHIERVALRKLRMLDAAALDDLRVPQRNWLEAPRGDRAGQFSIRINDQNRICFRWENGDAHDVAIADSH